MVLQVFRIYDPKEIDSLVFLTMASRRINEFVEVRITQDKGRSLFALKDIAKREVFMEEMANLVFRIQDITNPFWQFRFALTIMVKKMKGDEETLAKFYSIHPIRKDHPHISETQKHFNLVKSAFLESLSDAAKKNFQMANEDDFVHILAKIRLNGFESINPILFCLFKDFSLINHSCDPNVALAYRTESDESEGRDVVLNAVALKNIRSGEELTFRYNTECTPEISKEERKRILKERYFFDCTCPICK